MGRPNPNVRACLAATLLAVPCFVATAQGQEAGDDAPSQIALPFGSRPKVQEIRDWINNLPQQDRRQTITAFHERIGKPYLDKTRKQHNYKAPGIRDSDTKEIVFKETAKRKLKLFVDYPVDWKARSDRRVASQTDQRRTRPDPDGQVQKQKGLGRVAQVPAVCPPAQHQADPVPTLRASESVRIFHSPSAGPELRRGGRVGVRDEENDKNIRDKKMIQIRRSTTTLSGMIVARIA